MSPWKMDSARDGDGLGGAITAGPGRKLRASMPVGEQF